MGINLEQLISLVKKHKVACFGLGIQGRRMADFFFKLEHSRTVSGLY